jgi:hypothetical protein
MRVPAICRDPANRIEARFDVDVNFNAEGQAVCPREVTIKTVLTFEKFDGGTAYYKKQPEEITK